MMLRSIAGQVRSRLSISGLVTLGFLLLLAGHGMRAWGQVSPSTGKQAEPSAMYALTITRSAGFLKDLGAEPLEFFRRLGRLLEEQKGLFENGTFQVAGFNSPSFAISQPFKDRVFGNDLTKAQKGAVEKLFIQAESDLNRLAGSLPPVGDGLTFRGVFDPRGLVTPLGEMLEKGNTPPELKPGQVFRLKNRVLPFLQVADLVVLAGALTREGLVVRVKMVGGKAYRENIGAGGGLPQALTTVRYAASEAFMLFSQVHMSQDPAEMMAHLREFPQTAIVEKYLASVSLDLEKDLLANPGIETTITINLDPRGEGGLPDIQGIALVKDPVKLLTVTPNLKQLASTVGVFVAPILEDPASVRLSFFLAPTYGVHVALRGNLLLLASGREVFVEMARRLERIDGGKLAPFPGPGGVHRFWRVAFGRLNEQMQRFLQSPLIANKGIPPLSNIGVADELGDLTLETRLLPDGIGIDVDVPVRGGR